MADREREREHLAKADRHIAEAKAHIAPATGTAQTVGARQPRDRTGRGTAASFGKYARGLRVSSGDYSGAARQDAVRVPPSRKTLVTDRAMEAWYHPSIA
jgi:hypothetical protein